MRKISLRAFLWLCIKKAWDSAWDKADAVTTGIGIAIGIIVHYVPRWEAAMNGLYWEIPVAALASISVYRLAMSPFWLYREKEVEARELRKQLEKPIGELAEEDLKVWLRPLNAEVLSKGFMVFELLNQGQRVNPAQGITVQTIPCAPAVRFDYVDCLLANEHKRVTPIVGDFAPVRNILPDLDKAWREFDPERVDFEFQLKITYRDFRPRQFETTVTMKYCPLELDASNRDFPSTKDREYTFIKVTDTKFRRLS
jgi:hypothetical protein